MKEGEETDDSGDNSSKDVIDCLEQHDENETLLEKLGIKLKKGKTEDQMNDDELKVWRKAQRENEENQAKANEIVKAAKDRLN